MKPTIVNVIFALVLIGGKFLLNKNFLKSMLENSIQLEEKGWELLNQRWIIFFIFLALLNELVWRTQTEDFWVKFKVFGILPITLIFTMLQIGLINKYKKHKNDSISGQFHNFVRSFQISNKTSVLILFLLCRLALI